MFASSLRRGISRVPSALPLAALLGGIGGVYWWWVAALVVGVAAAARARSVAVAAVLCFAVAALHRANDARCEAAYGVALAGENPVLAGTVTRVMSKSVLLQPHWGCPSIHVRGPEQVRLGDVLRVRAVPAEEETPPPVPGMFDAAAWRRSQGCALSVDAAEWEVQGHPLSWAALRGACLAVRDALAARLMPPERTQDARRQVLCAMLLGARDWAQPETVSLFRRGGCLHIFAVSGLHVGMVAGFVVMLLRVLRVRPALARPLVLVVVGAYVLMTGCAVSALRAYLMLLVAVSSLMLRRRFSAANTWCFAALVILLVAPHEIRDAGFLLSFGVYAAIVAGGWLCTRFDGPWFGPDAYIPYRILTRGELLAYRVERCLRGVITVSLLAWLASLPVMLLCFHSLTPWSFLCNAVLALPVLLLMGCGLLLLALGSVPYIGAMLAVITDFCAGAVVKMVSFFALLPGAYLPAALPQAADALAVYDLGYGKSCCVLGNPGMVVGSGSDFSMRSLAAPALFHAGFAPSAALASPGDAALLEMWPGMVRVPAERAATYVTPAGRYTVYPPPSGLPRTPWQNRLPIVLWDAGTRRVLYVGDASAAVLEMVPRQERRADVVVLGAHPTLPAAETVDWEEWGRPDLLLLPPALKRQAELPAMPIPTPESERVP